MAWKQKSKYYRQSSLAFLTSLSFPTLKKNSILSIFQFAYLGNGHESKGRIECPPQSASTQDCVFAIGAVASALALQGTDGSAWVHLGDVPLGWDRL